MHQFFNNLVNYSA